MYDDSYVCMMTLLLPQMRKEQECADLVLVIGTSLSGLNADKVKEN